MPIGDAYIQPSDLEQRAGTDDGTYQLYIDAAAGDIDSFCGRQFNRDETATPRRFRATDRLVIPVDDFYTTTDLTVDVDGTVIDPAELDPHPPGGIRDGKPGWPFEKLYRKSATSGATLTWPIKALSVRLRVTVTTRWGWSAVPPRVRNANLILAHRYLKRGDAWAGVAGFGESGLTRLAENDPDVARTLEHFQTTAVLSLGA